MSTQTTAVAPTSDQPPTTSATTTTTPQDIQARLDEASRKSAERIDHVTQFMLLLLASISGCLSISALLGFVDVDPFVPAAFVPCCLLGMAVYRFSLFRQ